MMRVKAIVGIIILLLYCFPFVYFSMHQDFVTGTMLGYLMMVAVSSLLAYFGTYFSHAVVIALGNILSAIVSYYLIRGMSGEWDSGYFKPLTPESLLFWVSFLNIIPQLLAMQLAKRRKHKVK